MKAETQNSPTAVLISDVHYSLNTIALSNAVMKQAIECAADLKVPLIVAGDLHDTKANIRGECAAAMIATFKYAVAKEVTTVVLVGNHDRINEKTPAHSLEFLRPYVNHLVDSYDHWFGVHFIPYQNDAEEFERQLEKVPQGSLVVMHQGVTGAESGEYVYDKSAVNKELLADYRAISGHYHRAQNIKCGRPRKGGVGLMSYIGSPYTVTFAEANDGPKGFQILMEDGSLQQVRTNLRKHVIEHICLEDGQLVVSFENDIFDDDIVWVKLSGPSLEIDTVKKEKIRDVLGLTHLNFKFDKIPTDPSKLLDKEIEKKSNPELMDLLIDKSKESAEKKAELKALWRQL